MRKIMQWTSGALLIGAHTNRESWEKPAMKKYEFSLVLKGPLELTEEIADELFEAGCTDGTPGKSGGVFSIDFHRHADSLETAINSAIQDVNTAGYNVERVEIDAGAMPQRV